MRCRVHRVASAMPHPSPTSTRVPTALSSPKEYPLGPLRRHITTLLRPREEPNDPLGLAA